MIMEKLNTMDSSKMVTMKEKVLPIIIEVLLIFIINRYSIF